MKKAVVLLSGGLDSTTALYLAKKEGFEVYAISFDYGQKHDKELECAKIIAEEAGVADYIVVKTNMNTWGGSALTDSSIEVPEGNIDSKEIPVTYVPARNMIFLSFAASRQGCRAVCNRRSWVQSFPPHRCIPLARHRCRRGGAW